MADGEIGADYDVFISYSHKDENDLPNEADRAGASSIAVALKARGYSVWWDRDLLVGEDWDAKITSIMYQSKFTVGLLSHNALKSPHCVFEIRTTRGLNRLLPVTLEDLSEAMFPSEIENGVSLLNFAQADDPDLIEKLCEKLGPPSQAVPLKAPSTETLASTDINLVTVLTSGSGFLAGREAEETLLLEAWASCAEGADRAAKTDILVLYAQGGAGKTALLRRLVDRLAPTDFQGAEKVIGWSAYSQGAGENRSNADSDAFIIGALHFMGEAGELPTSAIDRARLLAARMKQTRTLLILDGIEPLQSLPDVNKGRLKDPGLQRLLSDLSLGHKGLVVITSRQHLPELANKAAPGVLSRPLDRLDNTAGAELLGHLGCRGKKDDMEAAAEECQGHALTVTLLGTYIDAVEGGDIACRDHLGLADMIDTAEDYAGSETARLAKRASAVMAGYIERFEALQRAGEGEAERLLLSIVGLFDRPAEGAAVNAILEGEPIAGLTEAFASWTPAEKSRRLGFAKQRLRELKLLLPADEQDAGMIDAHPLVRDHFGKALEQDRPDAYRAAHERLYRMYADAAPDLPEDLEEMQPLFHAINHGCKAGRHQEVFDEVYYARVRWGDEAFIIKQLGAYAANLGALAHFFDVPWGEPVSSLSESDKAAALNYAAFALRAMGRLAEAEEPEAAGLNVAITRENWKNAATAAGNLSELRLALGRIHDRGGKQGAVSAARQGVGYADRSEDDFEVIVNRTDLADALHQAGDLTEAETLFRDAEARQAQYQPNLPRLYSLQGYMFADLLLARGRAVEVRERYQQLVEWRMDGDPLLDRGLEELLSARALALVASHGGVQARSTAPARFDDALEALRLAGQDASIVTGLLARAGFRRFVFETERDVNALKGCEEDLSEAFEIADRSGMKLFLTDIALERARLALAHIPGALPETLVPLVEEVEEVIPAPEPEQPGFFASLFGKKAEPAPPPEVRTVLKTVSTGPAPPPPRTEPLTDLERGHLSAAEKHTDAAAALITETGYHRRDRELNDLRRRIAALS